MTETGCNFWAINLVDFRHASGRAPLLGTVEKVRYLFHFANRLGYFVPLTAADESNVPMTL